MYFCNIPTDSYLCCIETSLPYPETDLDRIAVLAVDRQAENDQFAAFVKQQDHEPVDALVHQLNNVIAPHIDCTTCGNCCKSLMINVSDTEANQLSGHLQQSRQTFDANYIEKGDSGAMLVNAIPCHFLAANRCTVYDYRFEGCREFPAMHLPLFKSRLFTTLMHYGRCPIIFNIVEGMKQEMGFTSKQDH